MRDTPPPPRKPALPTALVFGVLAAVGYLLGFVLVDDDVGLSALGSSRLWVGVGVTFGICALLGFLFLRFAPRSVVQERSGAQEKDEALTTTGGLVSAMVSFFGLGAVAFFLSDVAEIQLMDAIIWSPLAVGLGVLCVIPMLPLLLYVSYGKGAWIESFRQKQIEYLSKTFPKLTMPSILLISFGAGISEELLFRGLVQGWFVTVAPLFVAILVQAVLFGLAHAANLGYILFTFVLGIYFGVIYAVTGNLLVVMIGHTVYDIIALIFTASLLKDLDRRGPEGGQSSGRS